MKYLNYLLARLGWQLVCSTELERLREHWDMRRYVKDIRAYKRAHRKILDFPDEEENLENLCSDTCVHDPQYKEAKDDPSTTDRPAPQSAAEL